MPWREAGGVHPVLHPLWCGSVTLLPRPVLQHVGRRVMDAQWYDRLLGAAACVPTRTPRGVARLRCCRDLCYDTLVGG